MLDRGEQLGWFDSGEIVLMAIVSAAAFYFFLAHTLTTPQPFIPIDIFRDRNFVDRPGLHVRDAASCWSRRMALMAPFLQGVMGYPDHRCRAAARHPRHRHGGRHAGGGPADDPRRSRGLLVRRASRAASSRSTTRSTSRPTPPCFTIVWTSILQGVGLGFMFVPLNTHRAGDAAAGAAHPGHGHVDADPQSRRLDRRLHRHRQPHQQDHPDACAPGRERHALQSGAGRPGRGHARSRRPRRGARCWSSS